MHSYKIYNRCPHLAGWQEKSKAGRSGFRAVLKLLYGIYDRSMALSSPATRALDATSCLPISTTQWLVGDIYHQAMVEM